MKSMPVNPVTSWDIRNPKRDRTARSGRAAWYPYYAGYSPAFASTLIESAAGRKSLTIADPWNGSGTTSSAATQLGHVSYGFDLNPVMVVVAKARLVDKIESASLIPLALDIVSNLNLPLRKPDNEPLETWFDTSSAAAIRSLQQSVLRLLVPSGATVDVNKFSDLAAFFHVGLFSVVRGLLVDFTTSNPTWFRKTSHAGKVCGVTPATLGAAFHNVVSTMAKALTDTASMPKRPRACAVSVATSANLPLPDESVDLLLTSPPYCTRIDYAVATLPELATLGLSQPAVRRLRESMMGTATVPKTCGSPAMEWGHRCATFLASLSHHRSKASAGYYYKNHYEYFDRLAKSLSEVARVTRRGGYAVLVVQDSYYKDIHNPLHEITAEMGEYCGLTLARMERFHNKASMVHINTRARDYAPDRSLVEAVLCMRKE
jgi:DNA modification methylase